MESPESSSHDPLDATEKVPSSWLGDEDLEGPPTLVAPPAPKRPIPSILRRNANAPLAPDVAERIERASTGAPLHLTPPPAPSKPVVAIARVQPAKMPAKAAELSTVVHAKARISSEQVVPDSGLWMNDITSRRTIPLRPPAEVAPAVEPAKIEIDWEPPVETVSISESAKVEMAWEPPVEVAAEPAKVEVDWDPPTDIAPVDVEPPTLDAAVPPPVELATSEPAPRKAPSRKTKTKRHAGRRPPRVAVEPTKMASGSSELPTFGAGMLQSHKVRVKREVVAPALPASAASTFGAGMLQARKSHAGWIAAAVLVAAALTAAYVGTRGDSKPAAAALQK